MYRWLLCLRYLRTRYIALASIISVTLGVATLIVVNSVMAGFSAEMHKRMHGLASDILIDCHNSGGLPDPEGHLREIRRLLGEQLAGTSVSVHVPAMLGIEHNGHVITRQVNLVGIDPETYNRVSQFGQYLLHPQNREHVDFQLRENGYAPDRDGFPASGWDYRRGQAAYEQAIALERQRVQELTRAAQALRRAEAAPGQLGPPSQESLAAPPAGRGASPAGPIALASGQASETDGGTFQEPDSADPEDSLLQPLAPLAADEGSPAAASAGVADATAGPGFDPPPGLGDGEAHEFNPAHDQFCGIVLGIATCSTRGRDADGSVRDYFYCRPGDDVRMMFPTASETPRVVNQKFTVVDLYESGMSEYDATFAFVPLERLQDYRGMIDPASGQRSVTTIQLKLAEGVSLNAVRDQLRQRFPPERYAYNIQTWRDMQGPLLAAVQLETTILNILLFLIIAVAGFGILATFFMIVVEKTRDIGTLKALGASGSGVMSIFLSYGLLLGLVGSGVGLIGGLLFVRHINKIAGVIERITGQEVFDPTIYYFNEIPTIVEPWTVVLVMCGAVTIATLASILPALRAARMHPVQALRYE